MNTLLVLDTNFLCWRAHHTTGTLTFMKKPTGVIYGVLREIMKLRDQFMSKDFYFCFDSPGSLRRQLCSSYKRVRELRVQTMSKDDRFLYDKTKDQIQELQHTVLKEIGFNNIYARNGYEADDWIAAICLKYGLYNNIVIVSADHDLYQLLDTNVSIWNPILAKAYTMDSFRKEFKLEPCQWPMVKAIAGCKTDNIRGVDGVREKTASKYVAGSLGKHTATHKAIAAMSRLKHPSLDWAWQDNLPLVKLPFDDTLVVTAVEDAVTKASWKKALVVYGIESLDRQVR